MHGVTTIDTTGCTGPQENGWIRYKSATDNNIGNQDLGTAFNCIAGIGNNGCGFEAQLGAVKRALERGRTPQDPVNGGFLRDDAILAIIIVTDEDDCSLPHDSLLGDTSQGTDNTSQLGPLLSFRCTEFGILCNGMKPPRSVSANLLDCASNDLATMTDPRHALIPVTGPSGLIAQVQALKPPAMTIVEAIAAPAPPDGPFSVMLQLVVGQMVATLGHSCAGGPGIGAGDPAVRIQQFIRAFDPNKKVIPVCQRSFASALDDIAARIALRLQ
jgi:hypothetical protein